MRSSEFTERIEFGLVTGRNGVRGKAREAIPCLVEVEAPEDVEEASIVLLDFESSFYEDESLEILKGKKCKIVLLVDDFFQEEEIQDPLVDEIIAMDDLGIEELEKFAFNPLILWVPELAEGEEVPEKVARLYKKWARLVEPNIGIYRSYKTLAEWETREVKRTEEESTGWFKRASEGIAELFNRLTEVFSLRFDPAYAVRGLESEEEESRREVFYVRLDDGRVEEISVMLERDKIKIESSCGEERIVTSDGKTIPLGYLSSEDVSKLIERIKEQ